MGAFDLPTGNLELLIDGKWESVWFADTITDEDIASCAVQWSEEGHDVAGARYNGHERPVPKGKLVVRYTIPADKIPDNCNECPINGDFPKCPLSDKVNYWKSYDNLVTYSRYTKKRHNKCPLSFVPLAK